MNGEYLDMEGCDALTFRVRGDGRRYIANLRTANWVVGDKAHDVWQAFLFARWALHSTHRCTVWSQASALLPK
jgi:NADH dehydrogenase [ubiquinone] 1 alpha subcomplex assembly factor 1